MVRRVFTLKLGPTQDRAITTGSRASRGRASPRSAISRRSRPTRSTSSPRRSRSGTAASAATAARSTSAAAISTSGTRGRRTRNTTPRSGTSSWRAGRLVAAPRVRLRAFPTRFHRPLSSHGSGRRPAREQAPRSNPDRPLDCFVAALLAMTGAMTGRAGKPDRIPGSSAPETGSITRSFLLFVIPAQAGIQGHRRDARPLTLDARLRGHDGLLSDSMNRASRRWHGVCDPSAIGPPAARRTLCAPSSVARSCRRPP
jgi:hypothetical protein